MFVFKPSVVRPAMLLSAVTNILTARRRLDRWSTYKMIGLSPQRDCAGPEAIPFVLPAFVNVVPSPRARDLIHQAARAFASSRGRHLLTCRRLSRLQVLLAPPRPMESDSCLADPGAGWSRPWLLTVECLLAIRRTGSEMLERVSGVSERLTYLTRSARDGLFCSAHGTRAVVFGCRWRA